MFEALQETDAGGLSEAANQIDAAVAGLFEAKQEDHLLLGLLAQAALRRAQGKLPEAWTAVEKVLEIAGEGPMKLHQADAYLESTRLWLEEGEYNKARRDLVRSKAMIDKMDYHRRDREVAGLEKYLAISEFPKGRKYLISLSFRGKASVRPAQVGGFDVNIVIHGSTAVRGRGDLVAYRWALWKLTAPWTHRTRPPHLGKRCAFSTSSTGPFPSNHSRKTPKGPKIALGNPDRPKYLAEP